MKYFVSLFALYAYVVALIGKFLLFLLVSTGFVRWNKNRKSIKKYKRTF
ncbi:hypothetical protein LQU94_07355 [Peptoniphilus sp. KCTC 25270]|nr:hypothetical protein [Peptoniphilus sp. KCTC 25270]MCD1147927.1 hypothetical protein [Peptoniphilus sp. KCTC 25270]